MWTARWSVLEMVFMIMDQKSVYEIWNRVPGRIRVVHCMEGAVENWGGDTNVVDISDYNIQTLA